MVAWQHGSFLPFINDSGWRWWYNGVGDILPVLVYRYQYSTAVLEFRKRYYTSIWKQMLLSLLFETKQSGKLEPVSSTIARPVSCCWSGIVILADSHTRETRMSRYRKTCTCRQMEVQTGNISGSNQWQRRATEPRCTSVQAALQTCQKI